MSKRLPRWLPVVLLAGLVVVLVAATGWAAESEDEARKRMADLTFFDVYVKGGGVIGYFILLMNMVMYGLVVQYFVTLRLTKLIPPGLTEELDDLFEDGDVDEVERLCEEDTSNALTRVLAKTLAQREFGYDAMEEAFGSALDTETLHMNQNIAWLNLISAIAPMFGLFGTVVGMIGAFNTIASKPNVSAALLAADISIALVTTTQGLFVAIPAICFYFFFANRVVRLASEIGGVAEDFLGRFRAAPEE